MLIGMHKNAVNIRRKPTTTRAKCMTVAEQHHCPDILMFKTFELPAV
jgi:hypothetical protein